MFARVSSSSSFLNFSSKLSSSCSSSTSKEMALMRLMMSRSGGRVIHIHTTRRHAAESLLASQLNRLRLMQKNPLPRSTAACFSSKAGGEDKADGAGDAKQEGKQEPPPEEEPEYPQEKIGFMRGSMYLIAFGVALGSLYFIVDELMPSRLSANYLFNEAFDVVKSNHEVLNRYGEPLKGYGRDGGGRREGRRNFIEHKNYTAEDGTKRLRIRFNIEGPFGHAFVFAEVTNGMKKGEWMYLLVQDYDTGRVMTIEDNRAMYDALSKSKTPEERAALEALVGSKS